MECPADEQVNNPISKSLSCQILMAYSIYNFHGKHINFFPHNIILSNDKLILPKLAVDEW